MVKASNFTLEKDSAFQQPVSAHKRTLSQKDLSGCLPLLWDDCTFYSQIVSLLCGVVKLGRHFQYAGTKQFGPYINYNDKLYKCHYFIT